MPRVRGKLVIVCASLVVLAGCRAEDPWVEGWEGGTVNGYQTPPMPGLVVITDPSELNPLVDTAGLVQRRGPFPYEEDGKVYENLQGRLPEQPLGYYREYTVPTPNVQGRGARRLVGGEKGELYYWRPERVEFVALHLPPS
jgi:ribonuclease T1